MLLGHSTDGQTMLFFLGSGSCLLRNQVQHLTHLHWKVLPQAAAGERDTLLKPQLLSHGPAPSWKPNILGSLRMVCTTGDVQECGTEGVPAIPRDSTHTQWVHQAEPSLAAWPSLQCSLEKFLLLAPLFPHCCMANATSVPCQPMWVNTSPAAPDILYKLPPPQLCSFCISPKGRFLSLAHHFLNLTQP